MKGNRYLRLMRFDKPVGIWLLWFPTAWALWLANKGSPPISLILLFFLGTVLMRAAGCVINDMADRHIDLHVKRTQWRPLTTGEVSLKEALLLLAGLLLGAFILLLQLPMLCFYYALIAIFITILYPFCKRFIQGPQFILGLAFSMGIPMAYAASGVPVNSTMWCLLAINFLWIVAYDSQYAMADREDDLRIGIKSTAILFATWDKVIIAILQMILHGLWFILALDLDYSPLFWSCWCLGAMILIHQQRLIAQRTPQHYLQAFSSNAWYGLILWLGIILNHVAWLAR